MDELLTLRAAARAAGVDDRTVRRWLAKGVVSAVDTPGGRRVAVAELLRAGLLRQAPEVRPGSENASGPPRHAELHRDTQGAALLRVEVDQLRARLASAEADRDRWFAAAERAQEQLGEVLRALPPAPERRPWFRWPWRR